MSIAKKIIVFVLLGSILILSSCSPISRVIRRDDQKGTRIRVLVYQGEEDVRIGSTADLIIKRMKDNKTLYKVMKRTVVMKGDRISTDYLVASESGYVSVNNRFYRGMMKVFVRNSKIHVINILSLESYLLSVVPSEILSSWPEEALKAQAVAARTYAWHQMQKGNPLYDVTAGTGSQVYSGIEKEKGSTTSAVMATEDLVLTYKGKPVLALFHSTCGGKTADDSDVWNGGDIPYLKSVNCTWCSASKHYSWTDSLYLADIEKYIQKRYAKVKDIRKIAFDKRNDRVVMVRVEYADGQLNIPGNTFRMLFPDKTLRSLYFEAKSAGRKIVFQGHGWGHGVGMCQWGARGLALKGKSYRQILSYYYSDVSLSRIN